MTLLTTGSIAEQLGADRDRVSYLIRKAKINPIGRAGMVRLYPPETISVVRELIGVRRLRAAEIESILAQFPAVVA